MFQKIKNMVNISAEKQLCLDTEHAKIHLDNGIIVAEWKKAFIDITIAKEVVNSRKRFSNGVNYPALIKINSIIDGSREAGVFLASEEACKGMLARAIVVDSIFETMLANLFVGRSKPFIPTRIFKNEKKAKKWLEQFIVNN